jgi:hypothetical protein
MSEVKRYTASIMHPGVREDPEGLLVAFEHLKKAKATLLAVQHLVDYLNRELEETKRERDQLAGIGIQCGCGEASCTADAESFHQALCKIRQLKNKLERLTQAGDAMLPLLGRGDYHIARNDWNAAKEGEQS